MSVEDYLKLEKECLDKYIDQQNELASTGEPFCPTRYVCFMCWPPTPANQKAVTSCPIELDTSFDLSGGTAEDLCDAHGNWSITESDCEHILTSGTVCRCHHCDALKYIMVAGYSVSLIALVVAFFMIVAIRALRVKRNKIHANLLASFICLYTLTLFSLILYFFVDEKPPYCQILLMLIMYFTLCNFCWMSLEGFYLYALVVLAFRIDPDKMQMWKYCLAGWGPSAILIICQSIVFVVQGTPDDQDYSEHVDYNATQSEITYSYDGSSDNEPPDCWYRENTPWQQYAFMIIPMLFLLAVNVFFLAMILKVLLPKIKTSGQNNIRNHLKMLKSAVVLVVLLGTVYIVFLIEPQIKNVTPLVKYVMSVINTTLQVTQGLAVAILYVFMNSDVQTKVRAKLNRRLMHLRLRSDSRLRSSSYANNKTQTFSVSDTSSNDANGGIHIARIADHNSNGGIPTNSATECNDEYHSDDVFQETSLIQIDNNTNGHAKLLEESETGEKLSEEEELSQALLIDVHL